MPPSNEGGWGVIDSQRLCASRSQSHTLFRHARVCRGRRLKEEKRKGRSINLKTDSLPLLARFKFLLNRFREGAPTVIAPWGPHSTHARCCRPRPAASQGGGVREHSGAAAAGSASAAPAPQIRARVSRVCLSLPARPPTLARQRAPPCTRSESQ